MEDLDSQRPTAADPHTASPTSGGGSRRTAASLSALTLGTFSVGLAEYILIGQLDLVSHGLGVTAALSGQLVTVFSLAYAILTPLLVAVLGRVSRRLILTVGLALFAATNLISFILPDFWSFAAVRILMAAAGGLVVVTSIASVDRVVPASLTGRGIATVQMGFTAALILGVPLGRILAEAAGWRSVLLVIAVLSAISLVLVRAILPSMPGEPSATVADQLRLLGRRSVLVGLAITLLWLGGYSLAYTYLTPYLLEPVGATGDTVTLVLFLFGLASLIGTQLGGAITDRRGHHVALVVTKSVHVLALLALPLFAGAVGGSIAILIIWSLAAWGSAAPQQMRVSSLEPSAAPMLIGLNQSTMQLGIAMGAGGGGALVAMFGVGILPWIAAAAVLASLILTIAAARRV